jgi:hypothetical protein
MDEDLYKPPSSDVEVIIPAKGSAIKGIVFGALTDVGGTIIAGIGFGIFYSIILLKLGVPEDQLVRNMENIETWSLPGLISIFIGAFMSALGGYVCAMKSVTNINRNALILSVISISFGLLMSRGEGVIESVFSIGLTMAAIFIGANYWKRKNLKRMSA